MPLVERVLGKGQSFNPQPYVLYPGESGRAFSNGDVQFLFYCRKEDDYSIIQPVGVEVIPTSGLAEMFEENEGYFGIPRIILYEGQSTFLRELRTEYGIRNVAYMHVPGDEVPPGARRIGQTREAS